MIADNSIAPNDALAVINHINAFGPDAEGEGESAAAPAAADDGDLLALLAWTWLRSRVPNCVRPLLGLNAEAPSRMNSPCRPGTS